MTGYKRVRSTPIAYIDFHLICEGILVNYKRERLTRFGLSKVPLVDDYFCWSDDDDRKQKVIIIV